MHECVLAAVHSEDCWRRIRKRHSASRAALFLGGRCLAPTIAASPSVSPLRARLKANLAAARSGLVLDRDSRRKKWPMPARPSRRLGRLAGIHDPAGPRHSCIPKRSSARSAAASATWRNSGRPSTSAAINSRSALPASPWQSEKLPIPRRCLAERCRRSCGSPFLLPASKPALIGHQRMKTEAAPCRCRARHGTRPACTAVPRTGGWAKLRRSGQLPSAATKMRTLVAQRLFAAARDPAAQCAPEHRQRLGDARSTVREPEEMTFVGHAERVP